MSAKTGISWTDSTWNPVTGCSKVSAGCKHCYAEREWPRFYGRTEVTVPLPHGPIVVNGVRLTERVTKRPFTHVVCHGDRLEYPIRWQRPRRIFVNSMSDLFHEDVPRDFIDQVFAVMALASQHVFQVLTKRPERMLQYTEYTEAADMGNIVQHMNRITGNQEAPPWPLPNVWLGVSVENQAAADARVPLLVQMPAAVHFVSAEPLLGPIDLRRWLIARCACGQAAPCNRHVDQPRSRVDWIIAGGESGPQARPMHPHWVRMIRDQCVSAGVAFFFKQWGAWVYGSVVPNNEYDGGACVETAHHGTHAITSARLLDDCDGQTTVAAVRVATNHAGDVLDGRVWHDYPPVST